MHQSLVWFPTVGTFVIAGPSNKELHTGSSMMVSKMRYDISDHEFLLVLLSYFYRINSIRTEDEGSQVVNMSLDLLAFNDVDRLLLSSNLIWSFMLGK